MNKKNECNKAADGDSKKESINRFKKWKWCRDKYLSCQKECSEVPLPEITYVFNNIKSLDTLVSDLYIYICVSIANKRRKLITHKIKM